MNEIQLLENLQRLQSLMKSFIRSKNQSWEQSFIAYYNHFFGKIAYIFNEYFNF